MNDLFSSSPWCDACGSYHPVPRDEAHHALLQCRASFSGSPIEVASLPRKALSVRQPWAWLIVNGWKNIENRTWWTSFRGPVLIHAAKGMSYAEYEACEIFMSGFLDPRRDIKLPRPSELQRGGIVGVASVLTCVREHASEWFCGPCGFVLADARPLPFVECRGALGFFEVEYKQP